MCVVMYTWNACVVYLFMCMHALYDSVCLHVCVNACSYVSVYVYTVVFTYTCECMCCVFIHAYVYTCMHACMCVYMCIIHTQHIRKTRAHKHTQYSHRYSATDIHTDIHRGTQDRDFK